MGIRHIPTGIQIRLHIPGKAFMVTEFRIEQVPFSVGTMWHFKHHLGLGGKNLPAGLSIRDNGNSLRWVATRTARNSNFGPANPFPWITNYQHWGWVTGSLLFLWGLWQWILTGERSSQGGFGFVLLPLPGSLLISRTHDLHMVGCGNGGYPEKTNMDLPPKRGLGNGLARWYSHSHDISTSIFPFHEQIYHILDHVFQGGIECCEEGATCMFDISCNAFHVFNRVTRGWLRRYDCQLVYICVVRWPAGTVPPRLLVQNSHLKPIKHNVSVRNPQYLAKPYSWLLSWKAALAPPSVTISS